MPEMLNPEFAFLRLLQRIDDPHAARVVVIIADHSGEVETASRGCKNDYEFFQLVHHVASGLAQDIIPTLEPGPTKGGPLLYVPRSGKWRH